METSGAGLTARTSAGSGPLMRRRTFLALAALGAVAACSGDPEPPLPTAPKVDLPKGEVFYGASMPPARLAAFERSVGAPLSCYRSYFRPGEEELLVAQARHDLAAGRMPITSIKPPSSWSETADDRLWMDSMLEPLSDVGAEIFFTVHHEPENDMESFGTAEDYVTMQNAIIDRASKVAPNVIVTPIVSSWTFDERAKRQPEAWNVKAAAVYGLDLYNPWSPTNGKDWIDFSDKLEPATGEAAGRPMLVGEYGCRSDPLQPGRAATWMNDAFTVAIESNVAAMAYFNSALNSPDGSWELNAETLPVFTSLLSSPEVARA